MLYGEHMGRVWDLPRRHRLDLLVCLLLFLTYPIYFHKLGQSSLVSWDEAWYAEIARNITKSGDLFNLTFNGRSYFDHPPFGFWLIAAGFWVFGVSDFYARLVPAVCGFLTLPVVYLLGKELFGRIVGFASAISLVSGIWFIYRARSGNLDSILTFFFMLTLLLAIKASRNSRYLVVFALSFAFLILTKTIVPFTIVPVIGLIFWRADVFKGVRLTEILGMLLPAVLVLVLVVGSWLFIRIIAGEDSINRILLIGLPGVSVKTDYYQNFVLMKEYLHSSIGKWFWPGLIGLILDVFLALFTRQKKFLYMSLFFVTFFTPFLTSNKGHIWHLVPLAPVMVLGWFSFLHYTMCKIADLNISRWLEDALGFDRKIAVNCVVLSICFYITFAQARQMWYQFIDIPAYVSDEAILSTESAKYPERLYIDGGDFTPAAVFYSGKQVTKIWEGGLLSLFDEEKSFVLITHQWRLDQSKILPTRYRILKQDRDKILVRKV